MKYISFGVVLLLLVSCSEIPNPVTPEMQVETTLQSVQETRTIEPSITTVATKLPTSTPVAFSSVYKLPLWMNNPDTSILAALIATDESPRKISFYNAATGENYELLLPKEISGYFWYDNANFGFLDKDLETVYRINIKTGQVYTEKVSAQSTRLLNKDWVNALQVFKETPQSDEITFDYVWPKTNSKNRGLSAKWNDSKNAIVVIDTKTNQIVWKSKPSENMYGTEFLWSPTNENLLAFLEGKPEPKSGFITESMKLTFVDVKKGEILSTYNGNFGMLEWAPDGKKILYQDPWFRYRNFGIGFSDAPCILFLETGVKKCLRNIPRLVPKEFTLMTTGLYQWSSNSESIFYTYLYSSSPEILEPVGNLCIYSLADGLRFK